MPLFVGLWHGDAVELPTSMPETDEQRHTTGNAVTERNRLSARPLRRFSLSWVVYSKFLFFRLLFCSLYQKVFCYNDERAARFFTEP